MTTITVSEFRKDIKKYAKKVREEDIIVVSNGKPIMKIVDPLRDRIEEIKKLRGIVTDFVEPEEVFKKRLEEL